MTGNESAGMSPAGDPRPTRDRRSRSGLERNRSAAKTGMAVAMGALVVTGMMRGRGAAKLHIVSGIALVGFSFWHHHLYYGVSRKSGT
jgi:hypothetical protein